MKNDHIQEFRRERLQALSDLFHGYANLGRSLGYRDGAYISQLCKGMRHVSEDFVARCEALPNAQSWFHSHEKSQDLFSPELVAHLHNMDGANRKRMENLLRTALNLPLIR